jgi:nicotinamide-nucleotide amidase
MRVEVLTIGDELLAGAIVDTNGAWLMARLYDTGLRAARKTCVGDEVPVIVEALSAAAGRGTDLLVVCGGLGPTDDDLTAKAASEAAGVAWTLHEEGRRLVDARLSALGIEVNARQLRQATLPEGAAVLENVNGTAPGFSVRYGDCTAFFLPGPPREFRPMVERYVLPWLGARVGDAAFATRVLKTFGKGESKVAEQVSAVTERFPDVEVGYRVHYPEIHLRLRAKGSDAAAARARCDAAAAEYADALGPILFGRDDDTLASVVGALLAERRESLALAESCTGGLLGALLTDVAGASRFLLGGIVSYADAVKRSDLGVPASLLEAHGAVSEPVAKAMAEGAQARFGSDHALAITGIAGPGGGTDEKPVGTVWLALSSAEKKTRTVTRHFRGDREMIRRVSAFAAMEILRQRLLGIE